jgi:hypothetical protein
MALTGDQTIAGAKTFSSNIVANITGNCSGSSGSCTGNSATATTCSGNAGTVTNGVYTSGDQTINGVKTFGSIPVAPASDPTTANQLTRKTYVDNFLYVSLVETVCVSDISISTPSTDTWYNPTSHEITLTSGKWLISYDINLYALFNNNGGYLKTTFSTTNNSESNNKYTDLGRISVSELYWSGHKTFIFSVASTTTYYLNILGHGYSNLYSLYVHGATTGDSVITAIKIGD